MSRKILAGFAAVVLVLAGCQGETVGPNSNPGGTQPPGIGGPQPTHIGDANLAAAIEADLTCLYQKAGLLPNESSSLGKFATIKSLLAADDIQGALDATANLIRFIELKWSQYKGAGTVDCGDGVLQSVEALKNQVILRLNVYVTTQGAVCEIPGGSPGTFCQSTDDSAFVYFPPEVFQELTYVSVETDPAGVTQLQDTFDEYPTYVRILTAPAITFSGSDKPLVVVCFNDEVRQNPASLLARLLLGKRHTDPTTGATSFTALPKPDYTDPALSDAVTAAQSLCGAPETSAFGFSNRTVLGRFVNKVLTAILPQVLQAQFGVDEMAFGGVGGSPEEFSDFGAIDPGMDFRSGGVGGSPEEFAPPAAAPGAPAMLPAAPPSGALVGMVSPDDNFSDWVTVTVKTGLGTPITGAAVTFTLTDPSLTGVYGDDPSAATFCNASTTLTVATDATGAAKVTCIRFGLTVGFKNLNATLDPTSIDPSACVIGAAGLCVAPSAADINYLVATVPGDPAKLSVTTAPGTVVAGAELSAQPVIQVQDAGGNPVGPNPGLSVTATVSTGGTIGGTTSVTTDSEGVATFTNLTLGGLVGIGYTITFSSGTLTPATANVTVSGPGPAASLSVAPATTTAQAGGTIPTLTATVRDAFTNPVAGVQVGVAATGLVCSAGCPGTTDALGTAAFSNLSIGGAVGAHVVTFSAADLADATATVTLTPGSAFSIAVVSPASYGPLAPFTTVSPNPTVRVEDEWNNLVTGATVAWQRTGDINNGSMVTPSGYSAVWKLGDGGNALTASTGPLTPVTFTAVTTTGGIINACVASGSLKKSEVGEYNAATGTFTGRFSIVPNNDFRIRKVTLSMSVTGESSGISNYPATLHVYRGLDMAGGLQYTGTPTEGAIQLDGDNGSAQDVMFQMTPEVGSSVLISGQDLVFVVTVTAPANRTLQLWYNSKPSSAGICPSSWLYKPGVTPPASGKDLVKGHLIRVSN